MGAGARGARGAITAAALIVVASVGHPFHLRVKLRWTAVASAEAVRGPNLAAQTSPARTPGQLPDGPGKATYESVCSLCHSPNAPAGKQWDRERWELKVIEMLQEEPEVTADERKVIVEYLTATFKPGGRIYINLAGTADLAKLLDVPLAEAESLVKHRTDKGPFTSVESVKSVPGLNAAKVDAKARDLEF